MNIYLDLFLTFAKAGACTFGGGYAMLPILQREVVQKKGWATDEELADYYAVGQCTPGIIAVNTATFIGAKQRGAIGGAVATFGVVLPSVLMITVIAACLHNFSHISAVAHAFAGIRACVCVLILQAVLKLRRASVKDLPSALIFVLAFVASAILGISPTLIVIASGSAGLVWYSLKGAERS